MFSNDSNIVYGIEKNRTLFTPFLNNDYFNLFSTHSNTLYATRENAIATDMNILYGTKENRILIAPLIENNYYNLFLDDSNVWDGIKEKEILPEFLLKNNYFTKQYKNSILSDANEEKSELKNEKTALKPYPKKYFLANGIIVSRDGDNLSMLELRSRKALISLHTIANNNFYDHNIRRIENFSDASTAVRWVNFISTLTLKPLETFYNFQKKLILPNFESPITPTQRVGLSLGYASLMECRDIIKEYQGEERPHSRFTNLINETIPLKESTFRQNDT